MLASATGVTRRTLERRFENHAGRSVSAEIRRLRLNKAKRLLTESELMIKEIATESGFRDPIRMHEVFMREVGLSPSSFRKQQRFEK